MIMRSNYAGKSKVRAKEAGWMGFDRYEWEGKGDVMCC